VRPLSALTDAQRATLADYADRLLGEIEADPARAPGQTPDATAGPVVPIVAPDSNHAGASAAGEKPGALPMPWAEQERDEARAEVNRLTRVLPPAELARLGEEYDHLDHDTRNKLESLAHDHAKAVAERDDARAEVARLQKALDHLTPARHQVGGVRRRCPICSDIIPEAEWSAHVSVHERAPMDERWSDAKE